MLRLAHDCLLALAVRRRAVVMAQVPTGLAKAPITFTDKATGALHQLTSTAGGTFSAFALPVGSDEVRVALPGFRTLLREATVETGVTTTVDLQMTLGATKNVVPVEAATTEVNTENLAVEGVINRQKIQELPLNGRNFLQLASLEPGVQVVNGSTSQYNSLFHVYILGGGGTSANVGPQPAITVDGASVRDAFTGGSAMNVSQEVVQEFQLSIPNYDLSTGISAVGALNVVTRSGGNDFHGSAYFFFRDHNMAAYPSLQRSALDPNPFFARRNPGAWIGGPIIKNKLFFFNYENVNQASAIVCTPNVPN